MSGESRRQSRRFLKCLREHTQQEGDIPVLRSNCCRISHSSYFLSVTPLNTPLYADLVKGCGCGFRLRKLHGREDCQSCGELKILKTAIMQAVVLFLSGRIPVGWTHWERNFSICQEGQCQPPPPTCFACFVYVSEWSHCLRGNFNSRINSKTPFCFYFRWSLTRFWRACLFPNKTDL